MLGDPRIINLYDKPRTPRPRSYSPPSLSESYATAVLLALLLTALVTGFFWLYEVIAHRGPPYVPSATFQPHHRQLPYLVAPEAPGPDMHSAAVKFATEDVRIGYEAMAAGVTPSKIRKFETSGRKKKIPARSAPAVVAESNRAVSQPSSLRVPFAGF